MKLKDFFIGTKATIQYAMKRIDESGYGVAFVVNDNQKLLGVVTDSDIRRSLLNGYELDTPVEKVMNTNPITLNEGESINFETLPLYGLLQIPIVDKQGIIKDVILVSKKEVVGHILNGKPEHKVKKVLVVGGAGYLGSVLCEKLLQKNYKVRVLDNLMYGDDGIKHIYHKKDFEFIYGDIRDLKTIVRSIKDVDAVIHLAAVVGDQASDLNPEETIESNYLASKMLSEVCKYSQINRFIFASTCSVYGASKPGKLLTETSELNPVSLYARMKIKSEQGILELEDENFSPTVFRMGTLFGESYRMRFDLVINTLTIQALKDSKFTIFGGNQYRSFCHIDDAAEAYIRCLETPIKEVKGQIFNVVTENRKIRDIGDLVRNMVPGSGMVVDKKSTDVRDYCVSSEKIKHTMSWKGRTKISDGIEDIKYSYSKGKYMDYPNKKYSNVESLRNYGN